MQNILLSRTNTKQYSKVISDTSQSEWIVHLSFSESFSSNLVNKKAHIYNQYIIEWAVLVLFIVIPDERHSNDKIRRTDSLHVWVANEKSD